LHAIASRSSRSPNKISASSLIALDQTPEHAHRLRRKAAMLHHSGYTPAH
jgi:hypothetical protein